MSRPLKALVALFALTAALPSTVIGQTGHKCRTESGGGTVSDAPCLSEARQGQAAYNASQARQYSDPEAAAGASNADARMLEDKAAAALGSGNFNKPMVLPVAPEQWQAILEGEQSVTAGAGADLQTDSKASQDCKSARRSYASEASSTQRNRAAIAAAKRAMYSACGEE